MNINYPLYYLYISIYHHRIREWYFSQYTQWLPDRRPGFDFQKGHHVQTSLFIVSTGGSLPEAKAAGVCSAEIHRTRNVTYTPHNLYDVRCKDKSTSTIRV